MAYLEVTNNSALDKHLEREYGRGCRCTGTKFEVYLIEKLNHSSVTQIQNFAS